MIPLLCLPPLLFPSGLGHAGVREAAQKVEGWSLGEVWCACSLGKPGDVGGGTCDLLQEKDVGLPCQGGLPCKPATSEFSFMVFFSTGGG